MKTEEIIFIIMLFLIVILTWLLIINLYKIKKLHKYYKKQIEIEYNHFWKDKYFIRTKFNKTYFGTIQQIMFQMINIFSETDNSYDFLSVMVDATLIGLETKEECEKYFNYISYNKGEEIKEYKDN